MPLKRCMPVDESTGMHEPYGLKVSMEWHGSICALGSDLAMMGLEFAILLP